MEKSTLIVIIQISRLQMERFPYGKYTKEFGEEAVKLIIEEGK